MNEEIKHSLKRFYEIYILRVYPLMLIAAGGVLLALLIYGTLIHPCEKDTDMDKLLNAKVRSVLGGRNAGNL